MSHGKSKVLTDAEILGLDLAGSHREGHHGPELLTDEQILQFKRVFDYHDRDHTGTIAEDELSSIMSSLGQNCTNAEVMDLINVIDLDGNGKIDFPDFLTMILTFSLSFGDADDEDIFEEIKYAFNTFDSDGSGDISIRDLRLIAETMAGDRVDPEVIDELIMEADVDGDGQVDYEALVPMLLGSDTMKISAQRIKRKKQLEKRRAELEEKRHQEEAEAADRKKKGAGAVAAAEAARAALVKEQTAHEKTMARLAMMEDALAAAGIELDDEEHRGAHADAPA